MAEAARGGRGTDVRRRGLSAGTGLRLLAELSGLAPGGLAPEAQDCFARRKGSNALRGEAARTGAEASDPERPWTRREERPRAARRRGGERSPAGGARAPRRQGADLPHAVAPGGHGFDRYRAAGRGGRGVEGRAREEARFLAPGDAADRSLEKRG